MSGDIEFDPSMRVFPDALALSPDGSQILAPGSGTISRWRTADGTADHLTGRGRVAWSPDGDLVATVGSEATVNVVDPATGEVVRELSGHTSEQAFDAGSPIFDLTFSADGRLLASAGMDGQVIVWSVDDGSQVASISTDNRYSATVAFNPDGGRLAVVGSKESARIFDVGSGEAIGALPGSNPSAFGLAWSPDGRFLAGAGMKNTPTVWDAETLEVIATSPGHSLKDVVFAPDSSAVAYSAHRDDTVRIWPIEDGRSTELVGHTDNPGALAFSPDGATLYSVSARDGVWAWEVATGEVARRFGPPQK